MRPNAGQGDVTVCRRSYEVDLRAFVRDARGARWAAFRHHYPVCAACAAEVRAWTELERTLRGGVSAAGSHPSEDDLRSWLDRPQALIPAYRRAVEHHLDACRSCADEVATVRAFDFTSLAPRPSVADALAASSRDVEPVAPAPPEVSPVVAVAAEPVALEPLAALPAAAESVAGEPVAAASLAVEPPAAVPCAEEPLAGEPLAFAEERPTEEPLPEEALTEEAVAEEPLAVEREVVEPVVAEPVADAAAADARATEALAVDADAGAELWTAAAADATSAAEAWTLAVDDGHDAEVSEPASRWPSPFDTPLYEPYARPHPPRLAVRLRRLATHPALLTGLAAAVLAPVVWHGGLSRFPFGHAFRDAGTVEAPGSPLVAGVRVALDAGSSSSRYDPPARSAPAAAVPSLVDPRAPAPAGDAGANSAADIGGADVDTASAPLRSDARPAVPVQTAGPDAEADPRSALPLEGVEEQPPLPAAAPAAPPARQAGEPAPSEGPPDAPVALPAAGEAAVEDGDVASSHDVTDPELDVARPVLVARTTVPAPSSESRAPRSWTATLLDATRAAEIPAGELGAGLVLEVPVPSEVPDGAVLQVRVQGTREAREIVERLALAGAAHEITVRVPASWLRAGDYRVELGVVGRDPAPLPLQTFAFSVR